MAKDKAAVVKNIIETLRKNKEKEEGKKAYDPAKQVEGYKERIKESGLDVEKETDKRSFLEKLFNLPDDQNVLFDFFEILNRPQQALFGGIKAAQEGENFLKGASDGLRGRKDTQFKEILHGMGMEETEGSFGFDDIAGFAGDVFIDPMNVAIPFSGQISKAGKAAKLAEASEDLAKLVTKADELNKGLKASADVAQAATELNNVQKAMEAAKGNIDAIKKLKTSVTGNELAMKGIKTGFKKTASFADSMTTTVLGHLDSVYAKNLAKQGMSGTSRELKALAGYQNIKTMFSKAFNAAKHLPNKLFEKVRLIRGKEAITAKKSFIQIQGQLEQLDEIAEKIVVNFKSTYGKDITLDEAKYFLSTIYEVGADVVDGGGKLTRQGLNRKTSIGSLLKDKDFMRSTGIAQIDAQNMDNFIKKYFPEFFEKNAVDGSMFVKRVSAVPNDTVDAYAFISEEIHDKFIDTFDAVRDGDVLVPKTVLHDANITTETLTEIMDVENEVIAYEGAIKNGSTKGFAVGSKEAIEYTRNEQEFMKIKKGITKIDKQLKSLAGKTDSDSLIKIRELTKARNVQLSKAAKIKKAQLRAHEQMVDLKTLLDNARLNKTNLYSSNGLTEETLTGSKMIDEALPKAADGSVELNYNMRHMLSDSRIQQLEEFAQLDGVTDGLDKINEVMMGIQKNLVEIMESGIEIEAGYLSHVITPEWEALKLNDAMNKSKKSWSSTRDLIGNPEAMGARRYKMSVMEANGVSKTHVKKLLEDGTITDTKYMELLNNKKDIDLFAKDLQSSFIDFVNKSTKATADSQLMLYTLEAAFTPTAGKSTIVNGVDSDYIKILQRDPTTGRYPKAPRGYTEVTASALKEKITRMKRYIKNDPKYTELFDRVEGMLDNNARDMLYIDNNINYLIGRLSDGKESNAMLKFVDFLTGIFKKNKLLSPGFQMRNIAGNVNNMNLAGMPMKDIMKYNKKAHSLLKEGDRLFELAAKGGQLTAEQAKVLETYTEFLSHGFSELGNAIHDIPEEWLNVNRSVNSYKAGKKSVERAQKAYDLAAKRASTSPSELQRLKDALELAKKEAVPMKLKGGLRNAYDNMVAFNMGKNQAQDANFRMAMYLYGKENPQFLIQYGYDSPQDAVRKVLFDYLDLSESERTVMRKVVPFYTFTKKNLGFQLANMQKNPKKYSEMVRAMNSSWDMLDLKEEEIDRYKIENFWIPIPFMSEDGKYSAIKTSLPLGDVGEWLDDPFRRAISSTSPIVRAPFEIATNTQVFSGMPIQEFKGQKGFQIPELGRKAEYALNQFGLDVPVSLGADLTRTGVNLAKGEGGSIGDVLEGAVGRTLWNTSNKNDTATRNAYNELDDMQNLMRYYKQEGVTILTLAEIENRRKFNSTKSIIEKLRQIKKR